MKATMEKTIKYRNIGIFYISFPYHTYIARVMHKYEDEKEKYDKYK